ncbi:hypothetical protein QQX98_000140 [Neonectria punicea]|uniref:Uncharacterized protein n=1 Tax=Neonectria punicea TaxID=979145 RepID=A0ABR1HVF2_9HYPO
MSEQTSQSWQGSRGTRSSPGLPQQRRFDESWVEVSSQPSSSSLSSIGDEIVTTGLRVGGPYTRRRRLQPPARSLPQQPTAIHASATEASSQEEYEESDSESEDERLLASSTKNVHPSEEEVDVDSDADSDGDNVTALGRVSDQPVFRPQPNAFSHPPSHQVQRSNSAASAMPPPPHPHSGFTRPSFSQRSQTRTNSAGPNFMSPAIREENDAALRASLTTLLSCAAAARALPKSKEEVESQRTSNTGVGPSTQPMGIRLVPESELDAEPSRAQRARPATPSPPRKRGSPTRSAAPTDKAKHSAATGSVTRAAKKKKIVQSEETLISPTLLTWVVSAGVVVLVSVVGFGAGYVIGREVGKQEALAVSVGSVNDTTSCGGEVIRSSGSGLRRLRWGAVGKSIVA